MPASAKFSPCLRRLACRLPSSQVSLDSTGIVVDALIEKGKTLESRTTADGCSRLCGRALPPKVTLSATSGTAAMKTTYFDDDDTLVIRLSDKPIVREVSQDWHTHIGYAADGTVVETVILDAARCGAWPLSVEHRQAA